MGRRALSYALPLVLATMLAAGLVGAYAALGGTDYEPAAVADPCLGRPDLAPRVGEEAPVERIALQLLDDAACQLTVSREELTIAIASRPAYLTLLADHQLSDNRVQTVIRASLRAALASK